MVMILMRALGVVLVLGCALAAPAWAGYDFDGDGNDDILWRNRENGTVAIWLMKSGEIHRSAFLGGVPLEWSLALIGDANGDGMDDVIWKNVNGTVAVWIMNGTTVFSVIFPGGVSPEWEVQR